jgi:hypothetical protein
LIDDSDKYEEVQKCLMCGRVASRKPMQIKVDKSLHRKPGIYGTGRYGKRTTV